MLAHDGVNFIDGDMFAHGVGQQIKLAGFIAGILQGAVQRRQPFALAQAVDQRAGKGIAVEQAVEIGAERQAVVADRAVATDCPALCSCSSGGSLPRGASRPYEFRSH
jgi:hypothetical protein